MSAGETIDAAGVTFAAITPSDTATLDGLRGVYVGTTGNLALMNMQGVSVTFVSVPAGTIIPVHAQKVMNTGTGASNLVGIF